MAPKELKALRLLMDSPRGAYGSELVSLSDGYLSRGTIYTLLDRLVAKGYVREEEEAPSPTLRIARTRHFITGLGQQAVLNYARDMGFEITPTSLPGVA